MKIKMKNKDLDLIAKEFKFHKHCYQQYAMSMPMALVQA